MNGSPNVAVRGAPTILLEKCRDSSRPLNCVVSSSYCIFLFLKRWFWTTSYKPILIFLLDLLNMFEVFLGVVFAFRFYLMADLPHFFYDRVM